MKITPDQYVYWEYGFVQLNATLVFTWLVMGVMVAGSWLITRRLSTGPRVSRWQSGLEVVVGYMREQVAEVMGGQPSRYTYFLGTLFVFISISNLLMIVPFYQPPTGSLSTTAALATCVFFAVPIYGISEQGVLGYLKHYIRPTAIMLPFRIISELSRTLALAVRLFGNVMSGTLIGGILLLIAPLFVPIVMQLLSLLIGQIHAYIFAVLAAVYIASAMRAHEQEESKQQEHAQEDSEYG
jgi:F-type H+-transporting ATPase subunit a